MEYMLVHQDEIKELTDRVNVIKKKIEKFDCSKDGSEKKLDVASS